MIIHARYTSMSINVIAAVIRVHRRYSLAGNTIHIEWIQSPALESVQGQIEMKHNSLWSSFEST